MTVEDQQTIPEWSLPHVLIVMGAGLVGSLLATFVVLLLVGEGLTVTTFAVIFGGQSVGSLVAMWILSLTRGTGRFRTDFGLVVRAADSWAIAAGVGLQIGVALLLSPFIELLFPEGAPQQEVAAIAEGSNSPVEVVLVLVTVAVLAPVVEELIFRGMLLSRLLRSMSGRWAVVVSAAAFAGVHLLDPNAVAVIPGLFIIGLVLGAMTLRRGNLSLAILTHAGVNLTAALLLIFSDEIIDWVENVTEQLDNVEAVVRLIS